jgi:hypothetical protein
MVGWSQGRGQLAEEFPFPDMGPVSKTFTDIDENDENAPGGKQ